MERLVRPALHAIIEAINGMENATAGKAKSDYASDWLLRHDRLPPLKDAIEAIDETLDE